MMSMILTVMFLSITTSMVMLIVTLIGNKIKMITTRLCLRPITIIIQVIIITIVMIILIRITTVLIITLMMVHNVTTTMVSFSGLRLLLLCLLLFLSFVRL